MAWWRRMVLFPVKKALVAVAARVKSRKDGKGILKLHDDVQTCEYQDVQVMWEILQNTEMYIEHQHQHQHKQQEEIR